MSRKLSHAGDMSEKNNISGYTQSEVSSNLLSVIEFHWIDSSEIKDMFDGLVFRVLKKCIRGYDFYENG